MIVRLSISEEFDLNDDIFFSDDDPFYEENKESYDLDTKVELMVNRFAESIDNLVIHNKVVNAISVEYIKD